MNDTDVSMPHLDWAVVLDPPGGWERPTRVAAFTTRDDAATVARARNRGAPDGWVFRVVQIDDPNPAPRPPSFTVDELRT